LAGRSRAAPERTYILNPFDKRCAAWDMARDITSPSSADQLATILIPEEKNSSSLYFSDAARALMSGAIVSLMRTAPGAWEFRDVIYALKNAERLKKLLSQTLETKDLIPQYFSNERTANDVISTVATKIQRYQYIAAAWSRAQQKISLTKWVTENSILVLGNDEATRSALDAINRVIFKRITELVLAQSESHTRRTWFFLDELRQAGKLDGLNSLLTMGRSKGACVAIGFQDIEGLASVYGDREAAEIAGLCANKAILRLDSPHTAKWAASVLGEREILEVRASSGTTSGENKGLGSTRTTSSGESSSVSEQVSKRELILGSEFMDIPPTNFEYGLLGTYLIPEVGAYRVKVGGEWLKNALHPPSKTIANLVRRGAEDEVLFPWNDDDFRRLGLPKEKEIYRPNGKFELEESEPIETEGTAPSEGDENYEKMMRLFKSEKP
jgi:type IV secretory pathway TraG/TraD family ATPase VirD4